MNTTNDIKARLRCGAPTEETWFELAARTNRERAEAADRIASLEAQVVALSASVQGEPIHQWRSRSLGYWYDAPKEKAYSRVDEFYEARTLYAAPPSIAAEQVLDAALTLAEKNEFIREVVQSVAEIPDRNSPEDQPEMMLVAGHELANIIESILQSIEERRSAPIAQQDGVRWDLFPGWLIDHCEGDIITEEGLQFALAAMLKADEYKDATPKSAPHHAQQDGAQPVKRAGIHIIKKDILDDECRGITIPAGRYDLYPEGSVLYTHPAQQDGIAIVRAALEAAKAVCSTMFAWSVNNNYSIASQEALYAVEHRIDTLDPAAILESITPAPAVEPTGEKK